MARGRSAWHALGAMGVFHALLAVGLAAAPGGLFGGVLVEGVVRQGAEPGPEPSTQGTSVEEAQPPGDGSVPLFDFRVGFWINLHHFLYSQAEGAQRGRPLASEDEAWAAAVEHYGEHWIGRDLLFDEGMRAIDFSLSEAGDREDLADVELEGELAFVLESVAPLYRAAHWPEHRSAHESWRDAIQPVLAEHLRPVAERLSGWFQSPWPVQPARVDLLVYANWAGAYTSDEPDHLRIGTLVPRRSELPEAFEVLVHEASHLAIHGIRVRIDELCAERGRRAPRALWHAILFFTVGEAVLESDLTDDDYRPYAYAHGLATGPMAAEYRALEAHWPAYLAGEAELDETLVAVLEAMSRVR